MTEGGPHSLQRGRDAGAGGRLHLCGTGLHAQDEVSAQVTGEARGAVAWPCLPVVFQDFLAPCQLGGSWGAPYPGHSRFLMPSGGSAKGQNDISISVASSLSLLCAPYVPSCFCFLWGAPSPDPAFWSAPRLTHSGTGVLLTVHTPHFAFCSP